MDVYKEWLGIPEGERPPNHYELLRLVQFEDDPDRIRAHYKKLNAHVRKYATGQYSVESQELLNELAKAMLCLTDPGRKREYDEGMGRVFEEDEDPLGRKPVLKVLAERGIISREQIQEVEDFADARGLSHRDAVVQMKLAELTDASQALAIELGMPFVDLSDTVPDDSILDQIPRNVVKRHTVLPLFVDDDVLLVACADEPEHELEEELRMRFGLPMRGVLATPLAINQGIAKYYAPGAREEAAAEGGQSDKPKKKSKQSKQKKKAAAQSAAPLTDAEKQQRKQLGILFMCWGVIGSVLFDQMLLKPYVFPTWTNVYIASILVPPIVIAYVLKVYWKKN